MKILTAVLFSCACAAAFAAPPTDASLEKLMQVQHIDAMWQDLSATTPDMAKQILSGSGEMKAVLERIPESKKARFSQITEQFLRDTAADTATPEFRGRLKKIVMQEMKTTYTQEEVDAMTAFFDTPVGQSLIRKQAAFTRKIMPAVIKETQALTEKRTRAYIRELERLAREPAKPQKSQKSK
jgi:putative periplasmic protein